MKQEAAFGAVFFDDKHLHQGGWFCRHGEEPRHADEATAVLDSGAVWLTNLDYSLEMKAGLNQHGRFRRADYLRENAEKLCRRLGLVDSMAATKAMAQLFTNAMSVARGMLGITEVPMESLRRGIRSNWSPDPVMPEHFALALENAENYFTKCERIVFREDVRIVPFKLHPVDHARRVLEDCAVPVGEWRVAPGPWPETPQAALDWVAGHPCPFLARIQVGGFAPEFNSLLNFGSNPAGGQGRRQWVTGQELLQLANLAGELVVHEVYECDGRGELSDLSRRLDLLAGPAMGSLSCGLVAENFWTALTTGLWPSPNVRREAQSKGWRWRNPLAPFVRAVDRYHCFNAAAGLQTRGMDVTGFGVGTVYVDAGSSSDEQLFRAAFETGLIPPLLRLEMKALMDIVAPSDVPRFREWLKDPMGILQAMFATGATARLLEMDDLAVASVFGKAKAE